MRASTEDRLGGRPPGKAWLVVPVVAAMVYGALALFAGVIERPGFDQINFHEPAIRIFAADWQARRSLDFVGYLSATTPGYHLLLASVCRFVTESTIGLQLAAMLFSLALLGLLASTLSRWSGSVFVGVGMSLAIGASQYVLPSGVWLLPDNAGWLCVTLALVLAMERRVDSRYMLWAGLLLMLTVLLRQSHAWVAAPLLVGAFMGDEPAAFWSRRRWTRSILCGLLLVPAALALGWFVLQWGGLTPPLFRTQLRPPDSKGGPINWAAPAFVLGVFGMYAPLLVGWWGPGLVRVWKGRRALVIAIGVATLAAATIPATTEDHAAGRRSGLWSIAGKLPAFADHTSPLVVALALIGAAAAVGLCAGRRPREVWVLASVFAGFVATQAVAFQLWQRYTEPLALIVLALMAAGAPGQPRERSWMRLGPAVLGMVLAGMTFLALKRAEPQRKLPAQELMEHVFPHADRSLTPRLNPGDPLRKPRATGGGV